MGSEAISWYWWPCIGRFVGGLVGRFVGGLVGRFVGGLVGGLVAGFVGRFVGGLVGGFVGGALPLAPAFVSTLGGLVARGVSDCIGTAVIDNGTAVIPGGLFLKLLR